MLRLLDPSDAVLDAVATPVRSYLQQRKDTVRCIVTSLTDENADLYNELKVQQSEIENVEGRSDEDNEEGVAAATVLWQPRLRNTEAHFGATGRAKRGRTDNGFAERRFGGSGSSSGGGGEATDGSIRKGDSPRDGQFDILGMLISIYGSKEPFVKEYRCLLANKLIKNLTYDTAKDLAILERLKLRFGEASMQHCDIMLKDVDESKRLNVTVQSKLSDAIEARSSLFAGGTAVFQSSKERTALVDVTVVSEHFWPPLQANDGLVLHPLAVEMMSAYNATYSVLKKPRQLQWRDQLGLVDLELEFSQPLRRRREDTCSSDGGAAGTAAGHGGQAARGERAVQLRLGRALRAGARDGQRGGRDAPRARRRSPRRAATVDGVRTRASARAHAPSSQTSNPGPPLSSRTARPVSRRSKKNLKPCGQPPSPLSLASPARSVTPASCRCTQSKSSRNASPPRTF